MNNKKAGNDFEKEFCKTLSKYDFWAYNTINKRAGQPADVIAVRNNRAYLIDCKDCANDVFALSRVEENQHSAMRKWELCGNNQGIFALNTSKGVYMIQCGVIEMLGIIGRDRLNITEICHYGVSFEMWEKAVD